MSNFIDTAIPYILLLIVIFFIWSKFRKHIKKLFEWIKELLKSKKHKEPSANTYEYVDYGG